MHSASQAGRSKAAADYGLEKVAFLPMVGAGLMAAGRMALPHLARGAMSLFGGKGMAALGAGSGAMAYNQARNSGSGVLSSLGQGAVSALGFGKGKLGMGAQAAGMAMGALQGGGGVPPPPAPGVGQNITG